MNVLRLDRSSHAGKESIEGGKVVLVEKLNWDGAFNDNERPKGLLCDRGGFRVSSSADKLCAAYSLIEALAKTVFETTRELRKTHATLTRVRRLFGLTGNEKTAHIKADVANPGSQTAHPAVEPQDAPESDPSAAPAAAASAPEPSAPPTKEKRKGHGRVPASAYRAAQHIAVDHESLRRGDSCPLCTQGRVYELAAPATLVRIVGRAPLGATCFHCKQLRCGACGHVFTARPPHEAQGEKCDESASSMIAVMHYGAGVPFHRLEKLQDNLGTPVPASRDYAARSSASTWIRRTASSSTPTSNGARRAAT